jgi:hypothetical protein
MTGPIRRRKSLPGLFNRIISQIVLTSDATRISTSC